MADLTTETAAMCESNKDWATKVIGSKGDEYEVRFCAQSGGSVQHDYECTCPSFTHTGRQCKHIRQVINEERRCGWNWEMEPGRSHNGACPSCRGPLVYLKVGV